MDNRCHLMDGELVCTETKKECSFEAPDDPEEYMNKCDAYNDYMGK